MPAIVRTLCVLSLLLPAAACSTFTWDLDQLRETRPTGSAFDQALAKEYLALAESEKQQFDWIDSSYFARKGRLAAMGRTPVPEDPSTWNEPRAAMDALKQGHTRLVAALDANNARERRPEQAARAQALYDCWVEQQEENWQVDDIAACREGFMTALAQLEAPPPAPAQPAPQAAPPPPVAPQMPEVYLVFFEWDKSAITPVAQRVLNQVAEDYRRGNITQVNLAGHADRSGPTTYNQRLSERRAKAVSDYLVERGVARDRISTQAFGENQPRVPTADGVKEAENRRVEIRMGQR